MGTIDSKVIFKAPANKRLEQPTLNDAPDEARDRSPIGRDGNLLLGKAEAQVLTGTAGIDTVSYKDSDAAVTVDLSSDKAQKGGYAEGDTLANIENLIGSKYADTLTGDENDNILQGGGGADTLTGGAGSDTASYVDADSAVTASIGSGSFVFTLNDPAAFDRLFSIENLIGSAHDDNLAGDKAANTLDGGAGNDTVNYGVSDKAVQVDLSLNVAQSGGHAEGDLLLNIENLIGSAYADTLAGDASANMLASGDGDDTLIGRAGNDTLTGGSGADVFSIAPDADSDTITDFSANDKDVLEFRNVFADLAAVKAAASEDNGNLRITLPESAGVLTVQGLNNPDQLTADTVSIVIDTDDLLYGTGKQEVLDGGGGNDTVTYENSDAAVTVDLSSDKAQKGGYAEGDTLTSIENLIGSKYADTLTGDENDNVLQGGGGGDTLTGGGGNDTVSYADADEGVIVAFVSNFTFGGHAKGDTFISIENLIGSDHDDIFRAGAGDNTLQGGGGDDLLEGGDGADKIDGGKGNDTASYDASDAAVTVNLATNVALGGHAAGDTLTNIEDLDGSAHADTLTGDAADNTLAGFGGADKLDGGGGSDTASYVDSDEAVQVDLSSDKAQSGGHAEGDTLVNFENLFGTSREDTLTGDENDNILNGYGGADTLDGGKGNDTASYLFSFEAVQVDLSSSGPQKGGNAEGDTLVNFENLVGSRYADTLIGDAGDNVLTGSVGDNRLAELLGYTDDDLLKGGAGNDTLTGGSGADVFSIAPDADSDTITDFSANDKDVLEFRNVFADLAAVKAAASEDNGNLRITLPDNGGVLTVQGLDSADQLTADTVSIVIDTDDLLYGTDKQEVLDGGGGNDTVTYEDSDAAVTVDLSSAGTQSGGYAEGDTLISIENLIGSKYADSLTGDENDNVLTGGGGGDTLTGGGGGDTLTGGGGNDTASYADADAKIAVHVGGFGFVLNNPRATDTLISIENLIGSAYDDTLSSDGNANTLNGGAGNDWASYILSDKAVQVDLSVSGPQQSEGYAAGDTLINIENLIGSEHDDTLTGDDQDNILRGYTGADTLDGGKGNDTASYAESGAGVTVNLASDKAQKGGHAEGDTLSSIENLLGSDHADTLTGDKAANSLSSGDGDDTLRGLGGADKIEGGGGNDTASYAGSDAAVTVDLSSAAAQSGGHAAGDTLANIENLIGSDHADTLTGDASANILTGGGGDDTLRGLGGADKIEGGGGNDTASYAGSDAAVTVDLSSAAAQSGGHAAGDTLANIENLIGSDHADTLTGDASANILTGGGGDDTLRGLGGADKIEGGGGNDTASYAGSDAAVTVDLSSAAAQSGGHAAGDTLSSIENLLGSDHADTLTGDDEDNILRGYTGADTLDGGKGNDTASYAGSGAGVTVNLASAAAQSGGHAAGDTLANIENLIGSDHGDTLSGDKAANTLSGAGGDDTLIGRAGADILTGGGGADVFSIAPDADSDTITDFSANDKDVLEFRNVFDDLAAVKAAASEDNGNLRITLPDNGGVLTVQGLNSADQLTADTVSIVNAPVDPVDPDPVDPVDPVVPVDPDQGGSGQGDADKLLYGTAAKDDLIGGGGNDTVTYENSDEGVRIYLATNIAKGGYAEGDTLTSIENLIGSDYADVLSGDKNDNALTGGGGNDTLSGLDGADKIEGGGGNDTASYRLSDKAVQVDLSSKAAQSGGQAEGDTLSSIENLMGSAHADTLTGDAADNTLTGLGGADKIDGGIGNDTVSYAGGGAVQVDLSSDKAQSGGHAEGDTLVSIENLIGSLFPDTLSGDEKANILDGSASYDTVSYENSDAAVTVDLSSDEAQKGGYAEGDKLLSIENLIGSAYRDSLTGDAGDNVLTGGVGNRLAVFGYTDDDLLEGGAGNDLLVGGAGGDFLEGGDGNDTASYAGSDAAVIVNLDQGDGVGGHAEGDTLVNIENLMGSDHADTLVGDAEDNSLSGGGDDDTLIGGAGNDTLTGGSGADVFSIASEADSDTITDFSANEQDVLEFRDVFADLAAVKAAASEDNGNLRITLPESAGVLTVQGLDNPDQLTADTVRLINVPVDPDPVDPDPVDPVVPVDPNPVDPGQGQGGAGQGQGGAGQGQGGAGQGQGGAGQGQGGAGQGQGGAGQGQGGAGQGQGGAGQGQGQGGAGQGQGGAGQGQGGAGGALPPPPTPTPPTPQEDIKVQVGTAADDVISGDTGDDAITSAEGADRVDSSGGADTLFGRSGNDTLNGEQGDDVLFGESGDDQLAGGDGNDRLLGGSGNDRLEGGAGADTLHGGAGDDRLKGGAGKDVFVITPDGGHEQIVDFNVAQDRLDLPVADASAVTQSVAENGNIIIDVAGTQVTLQGITDFATVPVNYKVPMPLAETDALSQSTAANGNVVLTWDDFGPEHYIELPDVKSLAGLMIDYQAGLPDENNLLFGRTGNNVLLGGTGGDVLMGAALSDLLIGRGGHDVLFGGASTDLLAGRGGNDLLLGDAGDDILRGGAGDDLIWGGAGDNRLFGNAGADQFVISDGRNEQILDFNMEEDSLLLFTDKADSVQDLQVKSAIVDGLSGTQIALGNGNTVHLVGVDSAAVASLEIMFY